MYNNENEIVFIEKEIAISILNDDMTGPTDEEIDQIENYIFEVKGNPILLSLDEYEFTKCDITGKYAECLKCELQRRNK